MKKIITAFCIAFIAFSLSAQVNIQYTSVNEYRFNTSEALNLSVTNSNPKAIAAYFKGKIFDAAGVQINEFSTAGTILQNGLNVFTPFTLSYADIFWYNQDIYDIETRTGSFPAGDYTVCIQAFCSDPDCSGAGPDAISYEQKTCLQVHVENPTPLILTFPENEAETEQVRPLYTWIPPAPVAGSENLNYTLRLVELYDGQSKADALLNNRPLLESEGLAQPSLSHPFDVAALEPGKWYAWQVQAYVGKTPFASSEQWKFKVKKKEQEKDSTLYAVLSPRQDAGVYKISQDGYLYFVFSDYRENTTLNFEVLKSDQTPIKTETRQITTDQATLEEQTSSVPEFMGHGKFRLNISDLALKPEVYILHIIAQDKQHYYLKFSN